MDCASMHKSMNICSGNRFCMHYYKDNRTSFMYDSTKLGQCLGLLSLASLHTSFCSKGWAFVCTSLICLCVYIRLDHLMLSEHVNFTH